MPSTGVPMLSALNTSWAEPLSAVIAKSGKSIKDEPSEFSTTPAAIPKTEPAAAETETLTVESRTGLSKASCNCSLTAGEKLMPD